MFRRTGIVCVGGVLLLTVGCVTFPWSASVQSDDAGKEALATGNVYMLDGSVSSVSLATQNALRRMGLEVQATPEGENVRLTSTSRSGQRFSLVLSHFKATSGEQTQLRVEWDKNPEADLIMALLRILLTPPPPAEQPGMNEGPPR